MRTALLLTAALASLGCGHECRDLARDYAEALQPAKRCDPAAPDACTRPVPGSLDQSACPGYVDPGRADALEELVHRYASRGCEQPAPPPCALVVGRCEVQDGGEARCVP